MMAENTGITAIFGANSEAGVSVVRSLADTFKIPYFFAVDEIPMYEDSTAINIYPKLDALTKVGHWCHGYYMYLPSHFVIHTLNWYNSRRLCNSGSNWQF